MIRASESYNICTNIPVFNEQEYLSAEKTLQEKVGEGYDINNLDEYLEKRGIITVAKAFEKEIEKKKVYDADELPEGAKSYLEKLWLVNEKGLYPSTELKTEHVLSLKKGTIAEDSAIELLNLITNQDYVKNKLRRQKGFISGECDILRSNYVRDIKCPVSWETFRDRTEMELSHKWQLTSYCYIYSKEEAYVDYILMPTPEELMSDLLKYSSEWTKNRYIKTMENIKKLSPEQRIKTFHMDKQEVSERLGVLERRLIKSEDYYKSLTYEKCIKMV